MDDLVQADDELEPHQNARVASDEGGFVLPWFALLLLVLIAMAGFGVDVWNWWYTAQRAQRAADSGALAGVVFMPGNFNGAAPSASSTALFNINNNGYPNSSALIEVGDKPNQLKVSITQVVNNSFVSLLGVSTTSITRSATAEFNEPVKMGSPKGSLANDPEHPPVDQHWLNIGAPAVDKHTGDRYADRVCLDSYECDGNNRNKVYTDTSYIFTVEVAPAQAGTSFDIQAYDPEYANGGTTCDDASSGASNWSNMTAANLSNLVTSFPGQFTAADVAAGGRYSGGQSMWCTGDDNTNLGTPQSTAWIVREPGGNAFQPLTNNPICWHQFKGYNSDFYALLNPASPTYDADFYNSFHREYTVCHVTSAKVGKYFVQVRSGVPYRGGAPSINQLTTNEDPPEDSTIAGQNRFSLRAVAPNSSNLASGVTVYAETHLPIYSNVLSNTNPPATPQFYLARMVPGGGASGRILQLFFYDIGDVGGGTTTITVSPPADATGTPPTCTWTANGGQAMPTNGTVSGCVVSGISQNSYPSGYNGTLVETKIKVAGDYSCDVANSSGCWFKIQMSYTSGTQANDTTTWDANIGGDPVRLVK